MPQQYYYLIEFQYLGFRYHGWAKQLQLKTVHGYIDKTLRFILGDKKFKTLGASRTDGMVSATLSAVELFTSYPIATDQLLTELNRNLPQDMRALTVKEVSGKFNIIKSAKRKEYMYFFSFGAKNHPFSAPFITNILGSLALEQMKIGAKLFEGEHNFKQYCHRPKDHTRFERVVECCEIVDNDVLLANFFPEQSYIFRVVGEGFMRYQIRLMMGTLILLGRGEIGIDEISTSLKGESTFAPYVAPASGLVLNNIEFEMD